MVNFVHDWIGALHLVTSIIALIAGSMILLKKKGTAIHRKIGYVYTIAMVGVVGTAFMIYRLFGGWGIFRWAAVVSGATLAGGMIPVLLRKPESWLSLHFSFIYWSVMRLYAAFVAETLVRVPESPFFGMVGIGTGLVMLVGGSWFHYRKEYWAEQLEASG